MNFPPMISALLADLTPAGVMWELLAIAASLGFGALAARAIGKRFPESIFSTEIAFPAFAMLGVWVAEWGLARIEPVPLLQLVRVLLVSWLIVRGTVGVMQHAMPDSRAIRFLGSVGKWVVWGAAVLYVTGWLAPLLAYLHSIQLPLGKSPISLRDVLEALLAVVVTLIAALWFSSWLEGRMFKSDTIEPNLRLVLSKLLRAVLLFVAVLIAMGVAGIPLTALSVFGGALGVGLGLGLQRLAANYVSGFVILLDGSIKVGDNIRIDNFEGQVTGIRTRYTLVKAPNGRESIVPNETLVSNRVENLSLATPDVLCTMLVPAAYDSDIDRAMQVLKDAALSQPRVLKHPGPHACITKFDADGFELTLMFWISDPQNGQVALKGDIYREIWRGFQAQGIEVPFPQRVVRHYDASPAGRA
jgi:small-conductance mechanosensitive channel